MYTEGLYQDMGEIQHEVMPFEGLYQDMGEMQHEGNAF